jgi:hypothetical protein
MRAELQIHYEASGRGWAPEIDTFLDPEMATVLDCIPDSFRCICRSHTMTPGAPFSTSTPLTWSHGVGSSVSLLLPEFQSPHRYRQWWAKLLRSLTVNSLSYFVKKIF